MMPPKVIDCVALATPRSTTSRKPKISTKKFTCDRASGPRRERDVAAGDVAVDREHLPEQAPRARRGEGRFRALHRGVVVALDGEHRRVVRGVVQREPRARATDAR